MGPQKCFLLQRAFDNELYHYNYFYKYFCLYMEFVEMEEEVQECLDVDKIDDLLINERNDCLQLYEEEGNNPPELSLEGNMWLYLKPPVIESDKEDLTRIYDKETNITFDQIKDYICNEAVTGLFTSSPYQERQNQRNKQVNQMNFKMECHMYEFVNITRDNLRVHL